MELLLEQGLGEQLDLEAGFGPFLPEDVRLDSVLAKVYVPRFILAVVPPSADPSAEEEAQSRESEQEPPFTVSIQQKS